MGMTVLPTKGQWLGVVDTAEAQQVSSDLIDSVSQSLGMADETKLTVTGGAISVTQAAHAVDTEAGAATDDLTTISTDDIPAGRIIVLRGFDGSRVVTLKHGAGGDGQILLNGNADLALSNVSNRIALVLKDGSWCELFRSGLGAMAYKANVATADLQARAVTIAKLQAIATAVLLGRSSTGSGDIEQISLGGGLVLTGGVLSARASKTVFRPQTVMSGPVDSNGQPSFLPATNAALTLTMQNVDAGHPLMLTAAGGFDDLGRIDRIGKITSNQTFTGLAANATTYFYGAIAEDGTVTTDKTTLMPLYQDGGSPSTVNGQYTFIKSEMKGYVGNGSTADQVWWVFLGEATTNAGNVTGSAAYAYNGEYYGPLATAPAAAVDFSVNHNLGVTPRYWLLEAECITAADGYQPGQVLGPPFLSNGSVNHPHEQDVNRLTARNVGATGFTLRVRSTTAALVSLASNSNYGIRFVINRGW